MKVLVLIAACGNGAPAPAPAPTVTAAVSPSDAAETVIATGRERDRGSDEVAEVRVLAGGEQDPQHQSGRISLMSATTQVDTSLSADTVMAKIRSVYVPAVQRCYRDELKASPTLAGKETLVFGVTEIGRTVNPSATGLGVHVDACITTAMTKWRFAVPKANDQPTTSSFQIVFTFSPE